MEETMSLDVTGESSLGCQIVVNAYGSIVEHDEDDEGHVRTETSGHEVRFFWIRGPIWLWNFSISQSNLLCNFLGSSGHKMQLQRNVFSKEWARKLFL